MAAVNEDGELDSFWAAEVIERIHGGANGAAAKEDIIDEYDGFAGDIKGNDRGQNVWSSALIEVVSMHADIEAAGGDWLGPDIGQEKTETVGERNATALNSYESDFVAELVSFGNFVGDAGEGTVEGCGVEDEGGFRHAFLGHLTGWP